MDLEESRKNGVGKYLNQNIYANSFLMGQRKSQNKEARVG